MKVRHISKGGTKHQLKQRERIRQPFEVLAPQQNTKLLLSRLEFLRSRITAATETTPTEGATGKICTQIYQRSCFATSLAETAQLVQNPSRRLPKPPVAT